MEEEGEGEERRRLLEGEERRRLLGEEERRRLLGEEERRRLLGEEERQGLEELASRHSCRFARSCWKHRLAGAGDLQQGFVVQLELEPP